MSGRRHVVAGASPWRSAGKGAEDRHRDRDGELAEAAGERSSSETLTTTTTTVAAATTTQTTHTTFDLKRFINDKLDGRHKEKDRDTGVPDTLSVHPLRPDAIPPPAVARPGSVSPTPTQFSPTSTAVMASPPPAPSKALASPSKSVAASALAAAGRTYDGKLFAREMARYGALAHPPAALPPIGLAGASPSASTLALSSSGGAAGAPPGTMPIGHSHGHAHSHGLGSGYGLGADSAWAQLHVLVLPLFNHEQLNKPIEDLNALVKMHIVAVTSRPQRALATLEHDVSELINAGMVTLNSKLMNVDDEQLLNRVVELWGFFWDQVLPYVEGVFLPLQTSGLLINLSRTPKPQRPSSPDIGSSASATTPIDVRALSLRAFRDKIIVPLAPKLGARLLSTAHRRDKNGVPVPGAVGLGASGAVTEAAGYQHPRLQQMLLVLHSQAQRTRRALSLTAPALTPPAEELAIRKLLDAVVHARNPAGAGASTSTATSTPAALVADHRRPPSFLSSGAPRDRRGRVAGKANRRALFIEEPFVPPPAALGTRSRSALAHRQGETFFDDDDDGDGDNASDEGGFAYGGAAAGHGNGRNKSKTVDDVFGSEAGYGGATPRGRRSADGVSIGIGTGIGGGDSERERERKRTLLESLRSPTAADDDDGGLGDEEDDNASEDDYGGTIEGGSGGGAGAGGGLGASRRASGAWTQYSSLDRAEDASMNWDQAQAVVERMVGMGAHAGSFESDSMAYIPPSAPPLSRRRLT